MTPSGSCTGFYIRVRYLSLCRSQGKNFRINPVYVSPILVLRASKPAVVLVFLGGVIVSLQTLLQLDLKALIAYSRICHIALPTLILLIKLPPSATAATIIILGHGFVSSSMFIVGSYFSYSYMSRSILTISGCFSLNPVLFSF